MLVGILIASFIVGVCIWAAWNVTRTPRKPEHEREQRKMPDPVLTSHRGGQGGGF